MIGEIALGWLLLKTAKKSVPLEKLLRDRGARVTPQRVAILKAVRSAGRHPDAEAIYRYVSRKHSHISRDTVYRTLAMLEESGIIGSAMFVGNSRRYDPNIRKHHHLLCTRCRKIVDFSSPAFDRLSVPPSVVEEYKVLRTSVLIEAVCGKCLGARRA